MIIFNAYIYLVSSIVWAVLYLLVNEVLLR
jgi:hypothetical protein